MPHLTNRFSVLEASTVGSTRDVLTPQYTAKELKTEQAIVILMLCEHKELLGVVVGVIMS